MSSEPEIEVSIGAHLVDAEVALQSAHDLAWDHTLLASKLLDVQVGSDEFVAIFEEMKESYEFSADHIEFLTYTALILIRGLLREGLVKLACDFPITDQDLADYVGEVAELVVGSYAWVLAGQDIMFPDNDEIDEHATVTFTFPSSMVIQTDN